MAKFQVKLSGAWNDYSADEDKILKRAFLAGFPNTKYSLRGQNYECNFKDMLQKNLTSGKAREMRAPHKWSQPSSQIVKPGKTFCVKVPPGGPGTVIHVPHPSIKGQFVAVNVPKTAKVGQAMLVPVPQGDAKPVEYVEPDAAEAAEVAKLAEGPAKEAAKKKWSTGAKVAAGTAGVAVVGGLAVAGAVLGEHISAEGWDATMAELGDAAASAGDGIADVAAGAGDGIADAATSAGEGLADFGDSVGDFIMDLF